MDQFAMHDVVVITVPGSDPRRTWVVTELDPYPDARQGAPLVRIWPTDPEDVRIGQWVGADLLRLSDECPQHCPRCGVDLKAEGYPAGHKTDEGDQCEWQWE